MKVYIISKYDCNISFKTKELAEKYCDFKYQDYPELKEDIREIPLMENEDEF